MTTDTDTSQSRVRARRLNDDETRFMAEHVGVCKRPIMRQLIDTTTGEESLIPIPCGSTRERVCKSCADKAMRVRMQQCRDGWHREVEDPDVEVPNLLDVPLDDVYAIAAGCVTLAAPYAGPLPEPLPLRVAERPSPEPAGKVIAQHPTPGKHTTPGRPVVLTVSTGPQSPDDPDNDNDNDADDGESDDGPDTVRRSTRRREDAPPLPKVAMDERRTIGREITSPNGKTYRPSMFLTLTLPSYGPVWPDGTPKNPNTYDYRQAALDAMHFPKLVDRFWQNLRRCAGYKVQYFATVEAQKRLALHLHAAVRGTIPDAIVRQVVAATYHQVWWPPHERPVYTASLPVWSEQVGGYLDPHSGQSLDSWEQARARIDTREEPAHVSWFGSQVDRQWFLPGTKRSDKRIGYLTKYLTKSIAETYDPDTASVRQREHRDRLAAETRWLPCAPECANWLRYGVQPKNAEPGMIPGECDRPAHDPDNLGHGGRRALVSAQWSGKTLDVHRADRAQVVKAALAEAGISMPERDRYSTAATDDDGNPRYRWEPVDISRSENTDAYREAIEATITERIRWLNEYETAKLAAAQAAKAEHDAARARRPVAGSESQPAANHVAA